MAQVFIDIYIILQQQQEKKKNTIFSDHKMWDRNFMSDILKYFFQIATFKSLSVMSPRTDISNFQHKIVLKLSLLLIRSLSSLQFSEAD